MSFYRRTFLPPRLPPDPVEGDAKDLIAAKAQVAVVDGSASTARRRRRPAIARLLSPALMFEWHAKPLIALRLFPATIGDLLSCASRTQEKTPRAHNHGCWFARMAHGVFDLQVPFGDSDTV